VSKKIAKWKARAVIVGTIASVCAASYGVYKAIHSPLFVLQVVEVSDLPEHAPVDAQRITELAQAPIAKKSLFDVDLDAIQARILAEPWIRSVRLTKRFPQTLSVSVHFREPKAMLQKPNGKLAYVDSDSVVFGMVNLALSADLPVVSGISEKDSGKIASALQVIETWNQSQLASISQIASIAYDPERGYRAMISYPMLPKGRGRSVVELGQDIDTEFDPEVPRLGEVIKYLANNGLAARQIWASTGKKIVVKIARGS
jgi:cell division protein FtsQ